jgi:hypothetical protein
MLLYIDQEFIINSNNIEETEHELNKWIQDHHGQIIYGYEVRGDKAEDGWMEFLGENIDSNQKINLLTKSETEIKIELKESTIQYCLQITSNLPLVIEKLYGIQPESEENKMFYLFEGLSFLLSSFNHLNLKLDFVERKEAMKELKEKVIEKSYVEVADLLNYDWLPWIQVNHKKLLNLQVGI